MTSTAPSHPVEFRVRYAETDQMGVVYHANYLAWCEMGRTELLRSRGKSYAELEAEGILLAVSEASLRFHAPAHYDDLIRVTAMLEEVRSRMLSFTYEIARVEPRGGSSRLVSARTALVSIDRDGRPRALPAELLRLLRDAR